MRNVWMIRPPRGKEFEDSCLAGLVPADAGVRGDCSHVLTIEDAAELVMDANLEMKNTSQDSRARSLFLLLFGIISGDLLIIPLRGRRSHLLAMARPENSVACGYPARRVEILREIFGDLPADIANSMKAHACVCKVHAENMEERFGSLVAGEDAAPVDSGCPWSGHDFAAIVADMLRVDGYLCHVSPPGPDGGIDIRAGRGVLGTDDAVIVQVKATAAAVGISEVQRLMGIISTRGARGLIVSWGGLTPGAASLSNDLWPMMSHWQKPDFMERYQAKKSVDTLSS